MSGLGSTRLACATPGQSLGWQWGFKKVLHHWALTFSSANAEIDSRNLAGGVRAKLEKARRRRIRLMVDGK